VIVLKIVFPPTDARFENGVTGDLFPPDPTVTVFGPGFTVNPVAVLNAPAPPPPPVSLAPPPPPPTTTYSTLKGPAVTLKSPELVKV
jgi:hypothetical protein